MVCVYVTGNRILVRDRTTQSGEIYKWIKVKAMLKPVSKAQINLSYVCVCVCLCLHAYLCVCVVGGVSH